MFQYDLILRKSGIHRTVSLACKCPEPVIPGDSILYQGERYEITKMQNFGKLLQGKRSK